MKTAFALAAVAAFAILFLWQRSDFRGRAQRDAAAVAAAQGKADALAAENLALKQAMQKQSAAREAMTTGLPLALRYRERQTK